MNSVRAFACSAPSMWTGGQAPETTIYATSRSKARYEYFLTVRECAPDLNLIEINVRSIGTPGRDAAFERVAKRRGVEFAEIGMMVKVGERFGAIVGHNSSANFDIEFFDTGARMNCHPNYGITYYKHGYPIKSFPIRAAEAATC